ncbi:tetratricopeptide repeat protein [Yoonia maritima]|uniref:Tetratricopeptide repeat protein n=1 Tax=Yoonia maritima TaxID=1435347 RepID=A0A2T0VUT6_9RHOB|nr:tetratricopeptide repeat protein [Yoonia maritima]PRY75251.1 tetratricopeptide repeat protein [Yoonia maritima]
MLKRLLSAVAVSCLLSSGSAVLADPNAGAYLAGRQAVHDHDYGSGARYLTEGLLSDPSNPYLLDRAMTSYVALGQMDQAISIAQAIVDQGFNSQVAHLVLQMADVKSENWDGVFQALEKGRTVSPLIDGVAQAWAHLGNGDMTKASAGFDRVIETEGMVVYGVTHKAYALASVGDFEGAEAMFSMRIPGGMRYNRQSGIAHAQILSQLGRNEDALVILEGVFGAQLDPGLAQLRDQLQAGEAVAYSAVTTPEQGMAEIYHITAGAIQNDVPDAYTLMYARAANYLWPDNTVATLMTAGLLEKLGQYDLSNAAYTSVPRDDPAFHAAELGRADVLRSGGRVEAAIEVLDALARSHPDLPQVFTNQGDTLRQAGRYEEAGRAYTRAIELYADDDPTKWFAYYTRGICEHKTDNWPAAEADFRAALSLQPNHPQILNYLGYSLVERGEKLDEALSMLETAAAARPDHGAIIDSLGWVLFQLGRYDEAVGLLESAAELEPVDSVVNDHLGDVYWAVGREIEAKFQWNRALSFDPKETEALRIRDKLERGLDLVRLDEGLAPIRVASGDH